MQHIQRIIIIRVPYHLSDVIKLIVLYLVNNFVIVIFKTLSLVKNETELWEHSAMFTFFIQNLLNLTKKEMTCTCGNHEFSSGEDETV